MEKILAIAALVLCGTSSCTSSVQHETQPMLGDQQAAEAPTAENPPVTARDESSQSDSQRGSLRWQLEVEPNPLTMAQRGSCRVRILVTNAGHQAVDPQLHLAEFTLNGQRSIGFSLAFENGLMESNWLSLPPGETARAERALCETLFEAPGEYTLGFQQGRATQTVTVQVTP